MANEKIYVPVWKKYALTVYEAAEYFGIGEKKLRRIIQDNRYAEYLLWIGSRVEIKRELFEKYLDDIISV